MRTVFLSLLLLVGSFTAFAQHNFSLKPMPKIDFTTGNPASDSLKIAFDTLNIQPDYKLYFSEQKTPEIKKYKNKPQYRMPIATPGDFAWNMPIVVPDSSVNYAIRIKRLGAVSLPEK